jgi:hypothetical protein
VRRGSAGSTGHGRSGPRPASGPTRSLSGGGTCVYLIMPGPDRECFQAFLNALPRKFAESSPSRLILGLASSSRRSSTSNAIPKWQNPSPHCHTSASRSDLGRRCRTSVSNRLRCFKSAYREAPAPQCSVQSVLGVFWLHAADGTQRVRLQRASRAKLCAPHAWRQFTALYFSF